MTETIMKSVNFEAFNRDKGYINLDKILELPPGPL